MTVHHCDNCNKTIQVHRNLALRQGLAFLDLCSTCAEPIMETIYKQELLKPAVIKKLQSDPLSQL